MSRIFLAGAAGVIGRRLTPLLLAHGHSVWGSTRSPDNGEFLRKLGARPVVVDVFDAEALATAVLEAKPEIVIHQLTDLAVVHDPAKRSERPRPQCTHPRRRNSQPCRSRAQGRRASTDRAEHRLGLCAWTSTLSRRPSVGPECGGRPAGERAGRRVPRATGPRRLADGRRWCCAMAGCTAPAAARTRRPARRRCMSMRRLTPRCLRSTMASRGPSTSPIPMTRCRPTRRPPRLAGALTFGWI